MSVHKQHQTHDYCITLAVNYHDCMFLVVGKNGQLPNKNLYNMDPTLFHSKMITYTTKSRKVAWYSHIFHLKKCTIRYASKKLNPHFYYHHAGNTVYSSSSSILIIARRTFCDAATISFKFRVVAIMSGT